ncbi:MAG: NosD domain-containing protein [Candidatus Thorarchaeota archaeon]
MVRRGLALILICVLACSFNIQLYNSENLNPVRITARGVHSVSYVNHEPFNITSDADFETQSWPGNGSETNPYLIENLNITTNSSACIWIMNTTSHFIIQNCVLKSPYYTYVGYQAVFPLTLTNVSNGVVRANEIIESSAGISGLQISSCLISDNRFNVTSIAISVFLSNFTIIFNNTQEFDPCYSGINLYGCANLTVSQNRFGFVLSEGISAWSTFNSSITNNTLLAPSSDIYFPWSGISIMGCATCIIDENRIENFWVYGIEMTGIDLLVKGNNIRNSSSGFLVNTNTSIIQSNNITDCFTSIEMVNSNETEVHNNNLFGERGFYETGIALSGGSHCSIYSNHISNVGYGIIPQGVTSFNISYNTVNDGRYGFAFGWYGTNYPSTVPDGPCYDCDITNNAFDGGGLFPTIDNYEFWDFASIRFQDNTVNGRSIGFFAYLNDESIIGDDYGQLHLISCDSCTIYDGNFHGISSDVYAPFYDPGQASAITLVNCSRIQLNDVVFHNNTIGVIFQHSTECLLLRGSGYYNSWTGVIAMYSESIDVVDAYIRDNLKGISLGWSFDCEIQDCLIWENNEAVNFVNSMNCTLRGNSIFDNSDAIFLGDSDGCDILGNAVYTNSRGILLNSSSDCTIIQNEIYNNTGIGIYLDRTSNRNLIYNNVIAFNSPNAICEGLLNAWDNGVDTGNWWSDYGGTGPYIIDENDQDNYPIVNITTPMEPGPWNVDPLMVGIITVVVAFVILVAVIFYRRRVVIID